MNSPLPKTHPEGRFITIIINQGVSETLITALNKEFGITQFYCNNARGMTYIKSKLIGDFIFVEKDIITILVSTETADRIFEYIYNFLDIANKAGSFIYMGKTGYITKLKFDS